MKSRFRGATATALVALVVSLVAFGGTGAVATQNQAVIAGQSNSETTVTTVYDTSAGFTNDSCVPGGGAYSGFVGCGNFGVEGRGTTFGVTGTSNGDAGVSGDGNTQAVGVSGLGYDADGVQGISAHNNGVEGSSTSGNGVYGHVNTSGSSGVYGQNTGTGFGVAGRANSGTGVFGDSLGGTGVRASTEGGTALNATAGTGGTSITTQAPNSGMALKVTGKVQLSRSGTATVLATKSSVVVSNVALTAKSLVLATPQKNVTGVWVQGAVPNVAQHSITIYLSKSVSASYPVAWMVIEKP